MGYWKKQCCVEFMSLVNATELGSIEHLGVAREGVYLDEKGRFFLGFTPIAFGSQGGIYPVADTLMGAKRVAKVQAVYGDDGDVAFREAEVMANSRKPPLVPEVYDHFVIKCPIALRPTFPTDKISVTVMRKIDGMPMHRWREQNEVTLDQLRSIISNLCATAQQLALFGRAHKDIKPHNVVFDPSLSFAYLLDLGIARGVVAKSDEDDDMVRGTLGYMAPEVMRGEDLGLKDKELIDFDLRSEVYSLAVTIVEVIIGRKLVDNSELLDIVEVYKSMLNRKHIQAIEDSFFKEKLARLGVPGNAHENIVAILQKGLEPNPKLRWQSPAEFGAALLAVL